MKKKFVLGIDIGGSGIKGAIVNTKKGKFKSKRYRIPTPEPATPEAVVEVIKKIADHFEWSGVIGVGYPGVVQNGVVRTAANLDDGWIDKNIAELIYKATGCQTFVLNDADAAGTAEMKFGAGKDIDGVVSLITIGTGIGVVMFTGGKLVPNLELGHLLLHGDDAERYVSDATRKADDLSWDQWAQRFNEYIERLESLTWPDLIILGGGASKKDDLYLSELTSNAKIVPAKLKNKAGIIGAAVYGRRKEKKLNKEI